MKTHQAQLPPSSPPPPIFPDDLIVEILSWLPVKSLLRFRCVCKSWKSVISYPNFVKLHLHRSARNANLLLVLERKPHDVLVSCSLRSLLGNSSSIIDEEYSFPLNGDDSGYEVIGSCNGLVCLVGDSKQNWFREYRFYLWNPATKINSKDFACLCLSDSYYYRKFAFGYDNLSDTYKVLAFILNLNAKEESQRNQVKICSLGDNCWRNVNSFPVISFHDFDYPHNSGVYFNDTLNWLALSNINLDDYEWDDEWDDTITIAQLVIVSLDLGMETFKQLLLPRLDEVAPVEPMIGVLMNCLCFSHDSNRTYFVVWQMKEFGVEKSWTQFMKVSYQDLQFDCLDYPLILLCTSEKGDVLIMTTVPEWHAILYHQRDNRVESTKFPKYIHWYRDLDYVESLVSPCRS